MSRFSKALIIALVGLGGFLGVRFSIGEKPRGRVSLPVEEKVPLGIVVSETISLTSPSTSSRAAGDESLTGYASPELTPQNDLVILSRALCNFLIINKQSSQYPLSANEEWSSALLGKRLGTEKWFSENSPALDAQQRLIDRWGSPLHFHALGARKWEIRSAGLDRKLFNDDDLLAEFF